MQQMFTQEFINYQKNKWIELRLYEKINDKKILQHKKRYTMNGVSMRQKKGPPTCFLIFFIVAFIFFYYSNIKYRILLCFQIIMYGRERRYEEK